MNKTRPLDANRNIEADLIRRGDVLHLLYKIKENKDWPKNYGTLLTIISEIWKMPTAYDIDKVVEQLEERFLKEENFRARGVWLETIEIVKGNCCKNGNSSEGGAE